MNNLVGHMPKPNVISATTEVSPVAIDTDRLARLREKARLSAEIDTWRPEPGNVLEGAIVGSRQESGPFGPQHQALVQTPSGQVTAVWLTPWLLERLRAEDAEIGSLISITFHGQAQSQTGKRYNRMTVVVG
ncbi:MAG: hypothetical protein VBE63_23925 [Lamprobacter sp.]|uniref:hypothetical protein n=1 Tax=Lamprobacter sp. TaxID=3100796 RepID=UPI002B25DFB3|nr:hypothetical protein [Lamprobacter sp.]MEA3642964.1 hypothetical protein [Lamprobacter sp.]